MPSTLMYFGSRLVQVYFSIRAVTKHFELSLRLSVYVRVDRTLFVLQCQSLLLSHCCCCGGYGNVGGKGWWVE